MARIRCRMAAIISTIITDIEDHETYSQGTQDTAEQSSEPSDSEADVASTSVTVDYGLIPDWSMTFETYELLRPKLPKWSGSYKVIVDLDEGFLHVGVVPADLHGAASTAFNYSIESWANNFRQVPPSIIPPLRTRNDAGRSSHPSH